jgi:hypothetical protein
VPISGLTPFTTSLSMDMEVVSASKNAGVVGDLPET